MASASTTEVFNCSCEDFFKIISDYEHYPEFLSEVKHCEIIEEQEGRKLVEFTVNVLKTFKYKLWMTEDRPNKVSWEIHSGDVFKVSTGSWVLENEAGKVRATYNVEAQFKGFVPGPIAKGLVNVNLPNMISSYHKRVEELYG